MKASRPCAAEDRLELLACHRRYLADRLDPCRVKPRRGGGAYTPEVLDPDGVEEGELARLRHRQEPFRLGRLRGHLRHALSSGRSRPRAADRSLRARARLSSIAISTGVPAIWPSPRTSRNASSRDIPSTTGAVSRKIRKSWRRGLHVGIEVRLDDDQLRAEAPRLLCRHRRAHPERARLVRRRHHDPGTYGDRLAAQRGIVPLMHRGEERIDSPRG